MGFSRGGWWGLEWFCNVEAGIFDRFIAVAGYPMNRYTGTAEEMARIAAALKRHPCPSFWCASTKDYFCQVDKAFRAFYVELLRRGPEDSSCTTNIDYQLNHEGLREAWKTNPEMPAAYLRFVETGDRTGLEALQPQAPTAAPPPPPPPAFQLQPLPAWLG